MNAFTSKRIKENCFTLLLMDICFKLFLCDENNLRYIIENQLKRRKKYFSIYYMNPFLKSKQFQNKRDPSNIEFIKKVAAKFPTKLSN